MTQPATISSATDADRELRDQILEALPHEMQLGPEAIEKLDEIIAESRRATNELVKGYADQNSTFAGYIATQTRLAQDYYALALNMVLAAEKLLLLAKAPEGDRDVAQAILVFRGITAAVKAELGKTNTPTAPSVKPAEAPAAAPAIA